MKTFKDTRYGDLTGETFKGNVTVPINVESLDGAPEIVDGKFNCNSCRPLVSLKHSPRVVKGDFNCSWCVKLTDLKGAPESVDGTFNCANCNNLETLEGAPRKCKTFCCKGCSKLKNLTPLLRCDIEEVITSNNTLLEDYNKNKKIVEKHGYEAIEVIEVLDDLL